MNPFQAGVNVGREFDKTRQLMKDRELKQQSAEELKNLQSQIEEIEKPAMLALEEWKALGEDESGDDSTVSTAERSRAYRKVVTANVGVLQRKMAFLSGLSVSGNKYTRARVTPLLGKTMAAFQDLSKSLHDAAQYDVSVEQEAGLNRRSKEDVRVREEQVAASRAGIQERHEELQFQRQKWEALAPSRQIDLYGRVGEFVAAADSAGWDDSRINAVLPEGVDVNDFRDRDAHLTEAVRGEVKRMRARMHELQQRKEEGEDVDQLLAETQHDLKVLVRADDEREHLRYRRKRWNADHNFAERTAANLSEDITDLVHEYGWWLVAGPAGMLGHEVGKVFKAGIEYPHRPSEKRAFQRAEEAIK